MLLTLCLLVGPPVLACTCVQTPLRRYLRESQAVFVAKLVSVEKGAIWVTPFGTGIVVKAKVLESWKGVKAGDELFIATGNGDGDCGYPFEDLALRRDSTSLLFADKIPNKRSWYTTDICSGSKPLSHASAERETLNAWKVRGGISSPAKSGSGR